jgi:hypothetical protein
MQALLGVGCRLGADPGHGFRARIRLRDLGFETGYCPLTADNCFIATMTSASAVFI